MKRSSKKSRNLKKKSQKKCLLATGMMVCLGTFPVWSNDDVLLTLIPNAGKAFGSAAGIDYDYGLGAKLTYRKGDSLDFFLQGDYKRLAIDKLSPVDLMSISAGAGYHFKLNDRLGLNLSAQAGAYMASKSDGMVTGPTAGLSVSFTYRLNPVVSIEAGANVSHYAASPQPLLTDAGGSAALTVNLTEAFTDTTKVKMETNELLPVFPVLYSWYKNNAFATVGITNQEDAAIEDVTVSFYQSQFMNQPNVCAKVDKLGSGETVNAELTAFFNERMLDLTEKTDTEATVIIEYSYLGKKKKKEIGMIVPVYGRNSMSWDDDRRAAVFVSSKDPAALWFAKYISSIVRDNARPATRISQNIQYAMGIFETLDQFGLNYVIDPSSAYSDNVGGSSIDFLQFPFQTLTYRGGDCDDISILVCSLFEAVGIKTGFITIPGHIFMAFDSGLTMKEAGQSMMNTSNLFDLKGDGEAWIPLEITLTDEGFSRAWKVGAREWTTTAPEDRMFYAMEDCWKLYEPVSVPGATANFTLPEQKIVTRLFQHSMDNWIAKEISPVISQYNMLLARNESDQLRNELGILYGEYGLFVEADDQFKRARRNGYLPSLLNTANVYFARKQFAIALEWYKQVLEKDPENDLAMLGVARCNYELENFDECDKAYNYLRNKNPELANEYRYLGAFEETRGRSYSLADRLSLTIWDRGEFDSGIINDGTFEQQAELASREDENGFVTSDGANSSDFVDSDTANLFAQLTDMTDPSSVLRPDAIIADTQSYEKVPEDPYAKLDDPSVLVQELPGLIAQLRLPEPDFGNTDPVMISDYQLIAKTQPADTKTYTDAGATVVVGEKPVERTVSTQITQQQPATSTPVIAETSTKAEKKELIAFEKTDPEPTYIAQTPVTTTPSVTETRPSGQTSVTTQTPVTNEPAYTTQTTVTTQTPVTTEPAQIAQTPVTTTPTVTETRPSGQTTVTTTQPGYTTQTTVTTQTPVTNEPTYIAQTPVTTTPSVTETRPSGQTTVTTQQPAYTTQTPVTNEPTQIAQTPVTTTQPGYTTQTTVTTQTPVTTGPTYIAQTPVTTTPTVTETRPSGQTTATTTQPGYTTQTTVATQTPVTTEPTQIAQTPVTTTPSVTEARPSGQTSVTTQTPVTNEPTQIAQTPVTTTPSVTETRPSGQTTTVTTQQSGYTTQTTVATQTPVTNEPTYIAQTPVTTTPSVTTTQPGYTTQTTVTTQTPVTTEPTQIAQTPATTTPTVAETRPSGQTTTQTGYATQTPVTSEPTQIAQTPVTTTPSVTETRPSGQTSVTTTQPGYTTQTTVTTQTPVTSEPTYVAQTPVTTTPTVVETRPSGQTSVTTTQPGYTTQTPVTSEPTYVAQTPVTITPTVAETRPSGQTTTVTTQQPGYTTQSGYTTQTPVTTEPTQITQTPVTTTPSVTTTQPGYTTQTPVTTEPTQITQTPVTTTPSVTTTQPGYTTQTPVTSEPTQITQTPVTTTPSVVETRPSGQTTVTTTQPEYTTQIPVTSEPTQIAQTPVTTTPSVSETRPSGQTIVTTTQPGYTTQTPVTNEPTQIAQTPVTTTPTVVETRPSGQTTVTTQQPGYTTQTTIATQTPVTNEPTYIAQTPVTTTPSVTETRPSGQTAATTQQPGYTTQTTVTTQTPVTSEPTQITQTPVTTTPSVTTTQPGYTTQTTVTTQTPVTNEPTYIVQTPVTTTPSVVETRPSGQTTVTTTQPGYTTQTTVTTQTPVTNELTYIAQTPVTTTPTVTETRPSGQTTVTTTQPGYTTQTTVTTQTPVTNEPTYTTQTTVTTQTPVTNEPTYIAQTPVTTTPTVVETRPSGQTTTVTTTQQPAYTTQTPGTNEPTYIAQTPVTTTPTVTETRPSGQTTVTTTQPAYTTQTTVTTQTPVTTEPTQIAQTPVTTTPSVTETRPSGQTTVTTDDVMITDPEVDEWEYEFFEALMNPPNFDDLADAPIGIYEKDDKIVKAESTLPSFNTNIDSAVAIGPELPEEKIVEREAPRFTEQPSSRWVPEQVYSAKTIPGMKTYEEEMALYSNDKSWLYEDEPELLSDDSEETIQREKMQEEAAIREEQEKKNKGKFALTETDDEVLASLFQYLDENVLEEIQHTDLAERINEQARKKITGKKKTPVASTEPVVQDKKSGLLSKAEEINEKIEEEQIEEITAVQVEQMEPVAVNIDPEPKIDIGEDAGIKEKSKFNAGPYVAGGAGLVGLLIIFLLIFVKRDDDDDDDDKKKNPPKPEVRV